MRLCRDCAASSRSELVRRKMKDEFVLAEATGSLPVPVPQLVLDQVVDQRLGVFRILCHMHTVTRESAQVT